VVGRREGREADPPNYRSLSKGEDISRGELTGGIEKKMGPLVRRKGRYLKKRAKKRLAKEVCRKECEKKRYRGESKRKLTMRREALQSRLISRGKKEEEKHFGASKKQFNGETDQGSKKLVQRK